MIATEHSPPALSRAPQARRSRLLLTAVVGCAIPPACKNIGFRLVCCATFCADHSKIFLLCPLEIYLQVCSNPFLPVSSSCGSSFASSKLFCSFSSLLLSSGLFHCCLWQETLFGSLPVLSALPSEEEDLRGLDRLGNVTLIVKVRFAGNASEW